MRWPGCAASQSVAKLDAFAGFAGVVEAGNF
jgi:hypothetical protein